MTVFCPWKGRLLIVQGMVQKPGSKSTGDKIALESDELTIEERMRQLMRADAERVVSAADQENPRRPRDACTVAVLREAGVAGYQGDQEKEEDVEVALANAEFKAKQKLELDSGQVASSPNSISDLAPESVESDIDIEDLVQTSGYGKKPDVKPGTVDDALAVLNPSLFGASRTMAVKPFPTPSQQHLPTPASRPSGAFSIPVFSSTVPVISSSIENGFSHHGEDATRSRKPEKKKKAPPPSKHIAKVGAQAEAKQKKQEAEAKASGKCVQVASTRGAVRARRDEMDAFLFSDSDSGGENPSASLPEGGKNRERVIAAEKATRQAAAEAAAHRQAENKANRTKQQEDAVLRKQNAQKKAQKMERRR
ncbi:unnamed protein product [Calicophoron daubneyi]|uniref:Uncharacterized protein n=1 Tax=Calicophoron daubneyi TaxID=300641 RepID=A0AAV2SYV9_CALDB